MRRWFEEVWNQGRADAIPELFSEDGIAHGLSEDVNAPMKGPADFYPFTRNSAKPFPISRWSSKI
jgi:hypothetical protein